MKKLFYFLLFTAILLCGKFSASAQNVEASLGWGWFIEGVSPVQNLITVTQPPTGTVAAVFVVNDENGNPIVSLGKIDTEVSNGISHVLDMGLLKPNSKILVYFKNFANQNVGEVVTKDFNIIKKTEWLDSAKISNVKVNERIISLTAAYQLSAISNGIIPSDVTAIGGRSFGLNENVLNFNIDFSMDDRISVVSSPSLQFNLNVLNQKVSLQQFDLPDTNVSIDTDFELAMIAEASASSKPIEIKFRKIKIPLSPVFSVGVDGGLKFYGKLSGKIYYGMQDSKWGFIERDSNSTRATAVLYGIGRIRGSLDVLGGLASADGILTAYGRIGGGFQYITIPESKITPLFGGDINIFGQIELNIFFGRINLGTWGPDNLYSKNFGNLPNSIIAKSKDEVFSITSTTFKTPAEFVKNHPQPSLFSQGNNIGMNWIDNKENEGEFLLSLYEPGTKSFLKPLSIAKNKHSIAEPKSAFFADGSVLCAWTQNQFTDETLPANANIIDVFNAQDIWVSLRDKTTGKISTPKNISNVSHQDIADGKPNIALSPNEKTGIVTWLARINDQNNIFYSTITKQQEELIIGEALKLTDGANRDMSVVYISATKVLATWINDADNNEQTSNDRILGALWNGSTWTTPHVIVAENANIGLQNLVLDFKNAHAGMSWIATHYKDNGEFIKSVKTAIGIIENDVWVLKSDFEESDTLAYFQQPKIAISETGWVAVSYQYVPMAEDTMRPSQGETRLLIKNISDQSSSWKSIKGNDNIGNSLNFVWSLNTAFKGDTLYILTQEIDTVGNSTPVNGKRVGNNELGLVLRTVKLSADGKVEDTEEPNTSTSIFGEKTITDIKVLQNRPNPFTSSTMIEYSVSVAQHISLKIQDFQGNTIATLVNQFLPEGSYQTVFQQGNLPNGIYFYVLHAGKSVVTKKMIIEK